MLKTVHSVLTTHVLTCVCVCLFTQALRDLFRQVSSPSFEAGWSQGVAYSIDNVFVFPGHVFVTTIPRQRSHDSLQSSHDSLQSSHDSLHMSHDPTQNSHDPSQAVTGLSIILYLRRTFTIRGRIEGRGMIYNGICWSTI